MDKKKLKRIVDNPRHIPGIHNYCDKWCERCTKTLRCSVYAMSQAEGVNGPESSDPDNEAFWKYMHDIFSVTMEMVQDYARKNNIDLSPPTREELEREDRIHEQMYEHPLVTAGMQYMDEVRDWFKSNEQVFSQTAEEFKSRLQMELPSDDPEGEWLNLHNAIEVVQWYFAFISVKLRRAVHGLLDPLDLDEEELKDTPSDSDGSAKIALIGMDRSIWAWAVVLKSMPEQEKKILDFLIRLERLRRETEHTFPQARAFIRPGFDDIK
jgi:hypothetical protein